MNKYTEADVNRTHKIMVEELIDQLLQGWKVEDDPLRERMFYAVAAKLEGIREPDYSMYEMERILVQANMNAQEQNT